MAATGDSDSDTPEAINREQQDEGQAQDVANEALHPGRALGDSDRAPGDRTQILPDDVPDLVDTMNSMVRSGMIDNGAFAGEPQHDDEEDILGETEDDGEGDDALHNALADGSEDPLAVPVDLEAVADDGDDPLGRVASEHGLEDEDSDDDDDDYDVTDELADDGPEDDDDQDDNDEEEDEEDETDPDPDGDRDGGGDRMNPTP